MIKEIIKLLSNKYLREMIFAFMIIVIAQEYISVLFVRVILFIIAIAFALRPIFEDLK